jgi:hypothetical protein
LGGGLNQLKKQVFVNFVALACTNVMAFVHLLLYTNSTSFVCGNNGKGGRERERERKKKQKGLLIHTHAYVFLTFKKKTTLSICIRFIVYIA